MTRTSATTDQLKLVGFGQLFAFISAGDYYSSWGPLILALLLAFLAGFGLGHAGRGAPFTLAAGAAPQALLAWVGAYDVINAYSPRTAAHQLLRSWGATVDGRVAFAALLAATAGGAWAFGTWARAAAEKRGKKKR